MTNSIHRLFLFLLVLVVQFALTACTGMQERVSESADSFKPATPLPKQVLAPQGVLRVGVYLGSPTSLVMDAKTGVPSGVAFELGQALAKQLNVSVQIVQFARVAEVIDALKVGQIDMTFTNATVARAKEVDFTPALIQLELGVLVPLNSPIQSFEDLNRTSVRLGVSQGSSSQSALGQRLENSQIVSVQSLTQVPEMLATHQLDAFATNKGILFELAENMHGVKVLSGRWGVENLAIAIPKGRDVGMPYLLAFTKQVLEAGQVNEMAKRAGLRGMVQVN
jgi:polar amino acid transport system substrate-binding protein